VLRSLNHSRRVLAANDARQLPLSSNDRRVTQNAAVIGDDANDSTSDHTDVRVRHRCDQNRLRLKARVFAWIVNYLCDASDCTTACARATNQKCFVTGWLVWQGALTAFIKNLAQQFAPRKMRPIARVEMSVQLKNAAIKTNDQILSAEVVAILEDFDVMAFVIRHLKLEDFSSLVTPGNAVGIHPEKHLIRLWLPSTKPNSRSFFLTQQRHLTGLARKKSGGQNHRAEITRRDRLWIDAFSDLLLVQAAQAR
jgi:hypothetical protein